MAGNTQKMKPIGADAQASKCCDLLPCPFCGGEAGFDYDDNGYHWIWCTSCGVSTDTDKHMGDDCHPRLANIWNSRAG